MRNVLKIDSFADNVTKKYIKNMIKIVMILKIFKLNLLILLIVSNQMFN